MPNKVSLSQIFLQDLLINLDDITELEDGTIFGIEPLPIRSQEKDYNIAMEITFERNLDLKVIMREGYTILDYLSDIGGMQGVFQSTLVMLLSISNYKYIDSFLVSQLFNFKKPPPKIPIFQNNHTSSPTQMVPYKCDSLKQWLRDTLPSCMFRAKFCRPDFRTKAFNKAYGKLTSEINAIDLIRQRRFVNSALRLLLTKYQRDQLRRNSSRTTIFHRKSQEKNDNSDYEVYFCSSSSDAEKDFQYQDSTEILNCKNAKIDIKEDSVNNFIRNSQSPEVLVTR